MGARATSGDGVPDRALTRRGLIGGAAAGAAAATLPAGAPAARRSAQGVTKRADVVVIGAGFAGLMAALRIARSGRSVIVLEARGRVGGRVLNASIGGGEVVEVGGQWVGPRGPGGQHRMFALAQQFGVGTYPTYNTGNNVYYREQAGLLPTRIPFSSATPIFGPVPPDPGIAEIGVVLADLNRRAQEVPREAPWRAESAAEYDGKTFETYKNEMTVSPGARFLLDVGIEAVFAAEPRDVSLLFVLFYIAAAGDERTPGTFERLINTAGGAQERRFVGGSQRLAIKMAERLGSRVILGAPVRRIVQRADGVGAECDGLTVLAHQAIVAMAPAMTARIDYDPPLPPLREQLVQRYPMGSVIKCQAVYDRPFWRDAGYTGQVVGDRSPVKITFDNSPPDGRPGVMLGFIEGHDARVWGERSVSQRRAAVLRNFETYFGDSRFRTPRQYVERNWTAEVWSRGCYEGYTAPGVLLEYGPQIRRPFGRIRWAGTETSPIWNGYMEGAVRSGERAAAEALAALPRRGRRPGGGGGGGGNNVNRNVSVRDRGADEPSLALPEPGR